VKISDSSSKKKASPPLALRQNSGYNGASFNGLDAQFGVVEPMMEEPRYLPQPIKWSVLENGQIGATVFKTFTDTSEMIEVMTNVSSARPLSLCIFRSSI